MGLDYPIRYSLSHSILLGHKELVFDVNKLLSISNEMQVGIPDGVLWFPLLQPSPPQSCTSQNLMMLALFLLDIRRVPIGLQDNFLEGIANPILDNVLGIQLFQEALKLSLMDHLLHIKLFLLRGLHLIVLIVLLRP